ncbi:hypothetical protein BKA62DRAFT_738124, partial [Auriculariales sp. MPI-PUGE-AT-0066]
MSRRDCRRVVTPRAAASITEVETWTAQAARNNFASYNSEPGAKGSLAAARFFAGLGKLQNGEESRDEQFCFGPPHEHFLALKLHKHPTTNAQKGWAQRCRLEACHDNPQVGIKRVRCNELAERCPAPPWLSPTRTCLSPFLHIVDQSCRAAPVLRHASSLDSSILPRVPSVVSSIPKAPNSIKTPNSPLKIPQTHRLYPVHSMPSPAPSCHRGGMVAP